MFAGVQQSSVYPHSKLTWVNDLKKSFLFD